MFATLHPWVQSSNTKWQLRGHPIPGSRLPLVRDRQRGARIIMIDISASALTRPKGQQFHLTTLTISYDIAHCLLTRNQRCKWDFNYVYRSTGTRGKFECKCESRSRGKLKLRIIASKYVFAGLDQPYMNAPRFVSALSTPTRLGACPTVRCSPNFQVQPHKFPEQDHNT